MEDQTEDKNIKEKISLRRMLILILLILITTVVVGGVAWYSFDVTIKNQQTHIDSLNNEISEYTEKIKALSE